MSSMSTEQAMVNHYMKIAKQRQEEVRLMLDKLTDREKELVREAAVMGFVKGALAAGGIPKAEHPKDSAVLEDVLMSCKDHADLYPLIGTLDT